MTSASEASRPDADLLERLRHLDTASLSDANRNLRVLPPAIRPLVVGGHMAGRAVTAAANQDLMSVIGALERSSRPMPFEGFGSCSTGDRAEGNRNDDRVVGRAEHGYEVWDQIDGDREKRAPPHGQLLPARFNAIGSIV